MQWETKTNRLEKNASAFPLYASAPPLLVSSPLATRYSQSLWWGDVGAVTRCTSSRLLRQLLWALSLARGTPLVPLFFPQHPSSPGISFALVSLLPSAGVMSLSRTLSLSRCHVIDRTGQPVREGQCRQRAGLELRAVVVGCEDLEGR